MLSISTSTSPQTYNKMNYAASVLVKYFKIPPPKLCLCSNALILPNDCPVLKILDCQPSFQGQPVISPQLEVVSGRISPTKSWDGPPPRPPLTGPLARFRWQKQLLRTPRMLLSVLRTRGWVFKCVGFVWVNFKCPSFTCLAKDESVLCV
jgi:hypothetical protein